MTINTDMKIAILLPGQPRFTGDLDLFLSNLKGYSQADWFCYLSNNSSQVEQKSDSIKIHSSWIDYDIEWARAKIISNLPSGHQLQDFAVSDSESKSWPEVVQKVSFFSKPFPVFSMYYKLRGPNVATCSACATSTHDDNIVLVVVNAVDELGLFVGFVALGCHEGYSVVKGDLENY